MDEELKEAYEKTLINNGELWIKIYEVEKENQKLKDQNDYLKFLIKKYFVYDGRKHIIRKSTFNFDYETIKEVLE